MQGSSLHRHRPARPPSAWLAGWLAAALWLILLSPRLSHAQGTDSQQPRTLASAQLASGVCSHRSPAQSVSLPDDWREIGMKAPADGCYRFDLALPTAPDIPWALRMDRLPGNHRVSVNGIPLSTHHMDGHKITSMSTLPYLIEVPAGLLKAGHNEITIDVRMGPYRKPGVSPLVAGPLTELRSDFDRWVIWTVDVPRIVNLSVAGMALFLLLAWRARPGDQRFVYFGGLMVIMCFRNALYFLETVSWPTPVVDWLFFAAQAGTTYYLSCFGLSYANVDLKRVIWPLRLIGFGLPLVALGTLGTSNLDLLRLIAYPVMIICGLLVVVQVVRTALTRHWQEAVAMTLGPVATVVSVTHDYLFLTPLLPVTDLYWTPYSTPVIFLGYALTLMRHFVDNMNLAERMNVTLEERVAERTRALESANQSKTRFLAAASHDLRQPTAAIGLLVSLLRQQPSTSSETRELTNMLDEAVASMESLLVGLLDISRLDAGAVQPQFQPVSLHDVFQAVRVHEQSAAQAKGLDLRFRLPTGPNAHLMVMTDPLLLHSVLRNLVSNAIRYTQRGGVLVAARRKGKRRLRIEIWDTGIGIPADQMERIFEEFYQVGNTARDRSRGIGLGLAIVRRTASVLGEQISVRSKPGKGSVFTIELPLHHTTAPKPSVLVSPTQPLKNRSIWVVEDDLLLRRALTELLQSWGAHTRVWHDGESLMGELPLLIGPHQQDRLPDILISDYRLPGMDGVVLSQSVNTQLNMHGHHAAPLIISGDTDPTEIARMNSSGLHLMSKPFRSERLLEQLLALLKSRDHASLAH
ncbi:MAG TPA: ATP-binding protein [Aquabacterium sp.]|uniref:ATP-binding protein n=1 Tax=Aquabacterium sp. TaxID=1872578 RepID=UPI002E348607|nr:ATP-binding protein [Aquabacterium sp.]HEX5372397.1 ATP-binding protein [Aquabacterium sp.]